MPAEVSRSIRISNAVDTAPEAVCNGSVIGAPTARTLMLLTMRPVALTASDPSLRFDAGLLDEGRVLHHLGLEEIARMVAGADVDHIPLLRHRVLDGGLGERGGDRIMNAL